MLVKHIALFAMSLRTTYIVSNTVIQAVIEEFSNVTGDNLHYVESKIGALAGEIVSMDLRNHL
jgi:hypothetical protein